MKKGDVCFFISNFLPQIKNIKWTKGVTGLNLILIFNQSCLYDMEIALHTTIQVM